MYSFLNIFFAFLFISPVDYPITLAGNFGEPRPSHFHGGIDIKTAQVEGKIIHSIGDGYISRVTVGLYGYGNAIYVQHPEGYTSIYCHLKCFVPYLQTLVQKYQYLQKKPIVDLKFKPTDFPVSEGQIIALSGNTGASVAPHLHLEIHRTSTNEMVDPLDLIDADIIDSTPPLAHGFMATPVDGEGVFQDKPLKQVYPFTSHELNHNFTAWGKIGFGIWANDYMEGSFGNKYGIKDTRLIVDGQEVFHSNVSKISVDDNRKVNSWGDYLHYLRSNVWYMRSYLEPGNRMSAIFVDCNNGIIDFKEERDYHLCYIISDKFGNKAEYRFTVRGKRSIIPKASHKNVFCSIYANRPSLINLNDAFIYTREGIVANDIELSPLISINKNSLSKCISFSNTSLPLFSDALLGLRLISKVDDISKLYIVCHQGVDRFIRGWCNNGYVYSYIRDLGASYEISYDDIPPSIVPIGENKWANNGVITIGITDKQSGLSSFEAYIDNQFILLEPVAKSEWFRCKLKDSPIKPINKYRQLLLTTKDKLGNKSQYKTQILY